MAGNAGYYVVGFSDNKTPGIVKVGANQYPTSVSGRQVSTLAYLGTTPAEVKTNWTKGLLASGLGGSLLSEIGPTDAQGLASIADKHGAGLLTRANAAQADPLPGQVFVAFVGGLSVLGGLTVRAAELGAAAGGVGGGLVGGAETATTTEAAGSGGAAAAATKGIASTVASKGAQALTGAASALSVSALFSNIGLWKGVGMVLAGAVLVLIGILNLAGVDPGGIGHTAKRMMG